MTFGDIAAEDGVTDGAVWASVRDYAARNDLPMPMPRACAVSLLGASRVIGVSVDVLRRLKSKGLLCTPQCGSRYLIDDIRDALSRVGWQPGMPIAPVYDPNGRRGAAVLARRAEHGTDFRKCATCRNDFHLSAYPPSAAKYGIWQCRDCGRPYRKAADAKRRQIIDAATEHISHSVVARRDGWRCAICGGVVTRTNWSLDHVIPLSKGGLHTYANVVLAHVACNVARGAGRFPVQAPLFAQLKAA